jgi:hypothetical protein
MRVVQTSLVMGVLATAAACSSSSGTPASTNPPSDGGFVLPGDGSGGQLNPTPVTPPVTCGGKTCSPPMAGGPIMLQACCLSDNECGATFAAMGGGGGGAGGGCLSTAAGMPDTACPSQMMMGFPIMGCCTTKGLCGLDLTMVGLGCDPASDLAALAPPGAMAMSDAGPPETCAAAAAGGGADAASE